MDKKEYLMFVLIILKYICQLYILLCLLFIKYLIPVIKYSKTNGFYWLTTGVLNFPLTKRAHTPAEKSKFQMADIFWPRRERSAHIYRCLVRRYRTGGFLVP